MKKQLLNPNALFDPRFFTHTVAVSGPMKLVYVSGQVSYDRDGIVIGKGDFRAQAVQVFKSLTHNLKAAGAAWSDVIKVNGYMVDLNLEDVSIYREVRDRYFDRAAMPASTLVGVTQLVHEDLLLEVEVVAAVAEAAKAPRRPALKSPPKGAARKPAKKARR
jgi:enamine deaminase RidA (YjgF/YER057c/UK114 family)